MSKYKVRYGFMIEAEHISVMFNVNSRWDYLGYSNNYIRLHRNGVFVDIPKEAFEREFKEIKEQNKEEI